MSLNESIVEDSALEWWFGELGYALDPRPHSEQFGGSSAHMVPSSAHLQEPASGVAEQGDTDGCLLTDQLDAPVIDSLDHLTPEFRAGLEKLAFDPRVKERTSSEAMRQQHLNPLAKEGKLRLAFPTAPTHAKQAYRATE